MPCGVSSMQTVKLVNNRTRQSISRHRRGALVVLFALILPICFLLTAFAINIAFVQLSRTELLVATDAAARAGGRAMSQFQDVDDAKLAAQITAALNTVAGSPLKVSFEDSDDEIEFGISRASETSNRYVFLKIPTVAVRNGSRSANAVRVNGKLNDDSLNGTLRSLFPAMGLKDTFDLEQQAVATQVDRDIALILDRSGSMNSVSFSWPRGKNPWSDEVINAAVAAGIMNVYTSSRGRTRYSYARGYNETSFYQWAWEEYYGLGRAPKSAWDDLVNAVDTFLGVLEETEQNERVSLATYSTAATLNLELVTDYDLVRNELDGISPAGSTAIGYGLQTGLPSLLNVDLARRFAAKTIVVMTDGMHNRGIDPVDVAQEIAAQYDVTIHTVTFGHRADQERMQRVAEIGGGNHYHAATGEELIDVFEEIANNLPTLITQ